ncbi:FMN-binding protein [Natranaerobius trueperi]|uniref:FMN-binding protein n=1 Tax=Natranaerobius trueperi TaxID=759412 RepID=A0A226C333_9FIRM|nr:FMN-binding protein [Natranaerobius trueperi]OWZ84810.1 FMN-binding protein [Natranaerobius trueperi]
MKSFDRIALILGLLVIAFSLVFTGCGVETEEAETSQKENNEETNNNEVFEPATWTQNTDNTDFQDGTYRGYFGDGGDMQVNVQFTLEDNEITDINFRHLEYGGDDYLESEDDTIVGLKEQHKELLDYLEGEDVRTSLEGLYEPGEIVDDEIDGDSGATLRANKIAYAVRDGLNKGVYSFDGEVPEGYNPVLGESFEDGTYRGVFGDGGDMQVNVQFSLEDNVITDISFRHLYYSGDDYLESADETIEGFKEQHKELLDHLEGNDIRESLVDLYKPGDIVDSEVDGISGATLRSNKIISAVRDGLNKGVYSGDIADAYTPLPGHSFEDGTYRGIFEDGGDMQVNTQFTLEDNVITEIDFRHLYYGGEDYLETDDLTFGAIGEQHLDLLDYVEGEDIRVVIADLYEPGDIVETEVDGFSGATIRSNKIIYSIVDGLNKGIYTLP